MLGLKCVRMTALMLEQSSVRRDMLDLSLEAV